MYLQTILSIFLRIIQLTMYHRWNLATTADRVLSCSFTFQNISNVERQITVMTLMVMAFHAAIFIRNFVIFSC